MSDNEFEVTDALWAVFNHNRNGTISTAELRRILSSFRERLTDQEFEEMFLEAQVDRWPDKRTRFRAFQIYTTYKPYARHSSNISI